MKDNSISQARKTNNRRFADMYNRCSCGKTEREVMEPLRKELIGRAHGTVLEVGAGNGLNFPFYQPGKVERVEATEPDTAMLSYANENLQKAKVPITITQTPVEALSFPPAMFDCVVATLVFCSVSDPIQGFSEIKRVLKPDGTLLLLEHIRSKRAVLAGIQDLLVPLTKRILGNCHWNRDTLQSLRAAGFSLVEQRELGGILVPMVLIQAQA